MSESVVEFFVLFMLVAYSDVINRKLRKWYFNLTLRAENDMPLHQAFLILLVAFHVGLAFTAITCWILSFIPFFGFGAWNG
jgi:hypothetical protein